MTTEESLSVAVRGHLSGAGAMSQVKMFGGIGFLLNGNWSPPCPNAACSFVSVRIAIVTLLRGQGRGRWR